MNSVSKSLDVMLPFSPLTGESGWLDSTSKSLDFLSPPTPFLEVLKRSFKVEALGRFWTLCCGFLCMNSAVSCGSNKVVRYN